MGSRGREDLRQRIGVEHQAKGSGKGELETDTPQDLGVDQRHHRCHQGQAVQTVLAAPHLGGKQPQTAHDGGAHDGGIGPHHDGIESNA